MPYDHLHSDIDFEAPMTQGQALLILNKLDRIEDLLKQQLNKEPVPVTVKKFAELTGMGESTVTLHINKHLIEAKKLNGRTSPWRIPYSEVERIYKIKGRS